MKKIYITILSPVILFTLFYINIHLPKVSSDKESMPVTVQAGVKEGQSVPNFELETMEGKTVRLSDYRGQKILINFWASWCPPCKSEIPDLNEFYKEHKNQGFKILSVNMTYAEKDAESLLKFKDMYKINYPVLLDHSGDVGQSYGILTIPTSFIIDANGIMEKRIIGPLKLDSLEKLMKLND